jgi:hypothetical protein
VTDPNQATDYIARLSGTWDPGTVPALGDDDFYTAQQQVRQTIAPMLNLTVPLLDFHIVSTTPSVEGVLRTRWKIVTRAGGPTLYPDTTEPHPSDIYYTLRLQPLAQVKQLEVDVAASDWAYRGMLTGAIPAYLLREAWGTQPRQINVGSFGTGTFTPAAITYTALDGYTQRTVTFGQEDLADFVIEADQYSAGHQAIWLVVPPAEPDGDAMTHKLSYAVQPGGPYDVVDRWDDPAEPAPAFTPLAWTDVEGGE